MSAVYSLIESSQNPVGVAAAAVVAVVVVVVTITISLMRKWRHRKIKNFFVKDYMARTVLSNTVTSSHMWLLTVKLKLKNSFPVSVCFPLSH